MVSCLHSYLPESKEETMEEDRDFADLACLKDAVVELSERRPLCKFILAEVSNGSRSKKVLRASEEHRFHKDVFTSFVRETMKSFPQASAVCLGGGWISINHSGKYVRVWGESTEYGMEPREITLRIILESFPGYVVRLE